MTLARMPGPFAMLIAIATGAVLHIGGTRALIEASGFMPHPAAERIVNVAICSEPHVVDLPPERDGFWRNGDREVSPSGNVDAAEIRRELAVRPAGGFVRQLRCDPRPKPDDPPPLRRLAIP